MTDFFPASRDEILNWDGEDAEFLFKLNSHGIFPAPLENAEDFRQRLLKEYAYVQKISDEAVQKNSKIILWQTSNGSDKIEVRSDAVIVKIIGKSEKRCAADQVCDMLIYFHD